MYLLYFVLYSYYFWFMLFSVTGYSFVSDLWAKPLSEITGLYFVQCMLALLGDALHCRGCRVLYLLVIAGLCYLEIAILCYSEIAVFCYSEIAVLCYSEIAGLYHLEIACYMIQRSLDDIQRSLGYIIWRSLVIFFSGRWVIFCDHWYISFNDRWVISFKYHRVMSFSDLWVIHCCVGAGLCIIPRYFFEINTWIIKAEMKR